MEVICHHCGVINEYTVEIKSGQHVATCAACGKHIKNLPQGNKLTLMPFGKHKDREIASLTSADEIRYLRWLLENTKVKGALKNSITYHLSANK